MSNRENFWTYNQLELNFGLPNFTDLFQEIKKVASRAIANCAKSRWQIASEISEMTGIEISKAMLDAYTSESKGSHRFPAFIIPAFCISTGSFDLIRLLCQACKGEFLEKNEAIMAKIVRIEKRMAELEKKKQKLTHCLYLKSNKDGKKY